MALFTAASVAALGQAPGPQQEPPPNPAAQSSAQSAPGSHPAANSHAESAEENTLLSAGAFSIQTVDGEIKEDQLKQLLIGKTLYLRGGYQDNNLEFDEWGRLDGRSPQGSFTLSQIQINKVKLSKRKLELEGDRYALHFLGAAPYEDPTQATDRVKITPKKKTVRISFDREQVEAPRKKKEKRKHDDDDDKSADNRAISSQRNTTPTASDPAAPNVGFDHPPSDKKVTFTTSAAHASQLLLASLDKVFSPGIDDRLVGAMPDFWKLYYKAAAEKVDYKPTDPGVFPQGAVDQKAKLISVIDPPSNELAQANGVAGIALYHAVVGSDGKVEEVVAGRPIGFGLDENAEETIRKATFQPAIKGGKPVPVALDLVVSFRIYSKRTSQQGADMQVVSEKPNEPALPGPYTILEQAKAAQQSQSASQPASQPAQTTPATQSPQ